MVADRLIAISNAKLLTMGPLGIIEKGTVIIKGSKIVAVGDKLEIPSDAEIFDVEGSVVTPGLIDAHTHLGLLPLIEDPQATSNESTNPVTPEMRALDGVYPQDPGFKDAVSGGVTSVMVLPGGRSGPGETLNVIAGMGVVLKCSGTIADKMVLRQPACMKMGLGDRPKKTFNPSLDKRKKPFTRMGVASLIRTNLTKAKNYQTKVERAKKDPSKLVEIDLGMEALSALLRKEFPARVHAYRADDIYTAIRLSEEFGFNLTLDHAVEASLLVDELVERKISVVLGPLMHGKSIYELEKLSPETPSILSKKEVKFAITTDHPSRPIQYLPYALLTFFTAGLEWLEALKAITIYPAEIMGVSNRVGSLEAGKDADLAIFTEDPLEPLSRVEAVFVNGAKLYPKSA